MKKMLPILKTDEEAISLKLPSDLLAVVKLKAKKENIPYTRIIRQALEREVG